MMTEKGRAGESSKMLARVPQYVLDHAPLLHLYTTDPYRPSSIPAHLHHTHPCIDGNPLPPSFPPLTLANLDQLNGLGAEGGKHIYLTSTDDITTNPKWLEGITVTGGGVKTGVVIVVDKGEGVVDVFYFYFFAFNWGGVVLGKQLGDHVGDWEHTMLRFRHGAPEAIWLSQHGNGAAYTFSCLEKDKSGKRPILYIANGSHAIYPSAGTHDHTIPNVDLPTPLLLVDETDQGSLYDPLLCSWVYTYTPATPSPSSSSFAAGTYHALDDAPTAFLRFTGHWGDAEYPASDSRQKGKNLLCFKMYVDGPTGPGDKQLERREMWPENKWSKGQKVKTRVDGRGWWRDLVGSMKCGGRKGEGGKVQRVKVSGEIVG